MSLQEDFQRRKRAGEGPGENGDKMNKEATEVDPDGAGISLGRLAVDSDGAGIRDPGSFGEKSISGGKEDAGGEALRGAEGSKDRAGERDAGAGNAHEQE